MAKQPHRFSLFAQSLDRAAFIAYFMGAIIPLAAFAYLASVYLNSSPGESRLFLTTLVISLAGLSLASFLALRRTIGNAISQLDRENKRLEALVSGSRRLASTTDEVEVAKIALESALRIADAKAAYLCAQVVVTDRCIELLHSNATVCKFRIKRQCKRSRWNIPLQPGSKYRA